MELFSLLRRISLIAYSYIHDHTHHYLLVLELQHYARPAHLLPSPAANKKENRRGITADAIEYSCCYYG